MKKLLELLGFFDYCVSFVWFDDNDIYIGQVSVIVKSRDPKKAKKKAIKKLYTQAAQIEAFCEVVIEQI